MSESNHTPTTTRQCTQCTYKKDLKQFFRKGSSSTPRHWLICNACSERNAAAVRNKKARKQESAVAEAYAEGSKQQLMYQGLMSFVSIQSAELCAASTLTSTVSPSLPLTDNPPSPYCLSHLGPLSPHLSQGSMSTPSLGSKLCHELNQSVGDDNDADTEGEYELGDELGLDAQLNFLFSRANVKQDLMRFGSSVAAVTNSSNTASEVARVVFFLEEYARAARLSQLQLYWRGYLQRKRPKELFNEIELIAKRIMPTRTRRFDGRETLKLWQPLFAWIQLYVSEMDKLRSESKPSIPQFSKAKELLARLDRIAEDTIQLCQKGLTNSVRLLGLDDEDEVLKARLMRVWEAVEEDCEESGCLRMTTFLTADDCRFGKLSKRWMNVNGVMNE